MKPPKQERRYVVVDVERAAGFTRKRGRQDCAV
jgi:hypothetical protein